MLKDEKDAILGRYEAFLRTSVNWLKANELQGQLERILDPFVPESTVQSSTDVKIEKGRYYINGHDAGSTNSPGGMLVMMLLSHVGQEFSIVQLEQMSRMRTSSIREVISVLRKTLTQYSQELSLATIRKNPTTYAVVERNGRPYK